MNVIHINNETEEDIPKYELFISLINLVKTGLNLKYFVEINLIITTKDNIKALNNKYRNINKPTDVLSFPINVEENLKKIWGFNLLGDIYMTDAVIKENAIKKNNSNQYEYAYMFLHSVLHLLGYDHIEDKENIWMDEYIKLIIKKQGIIY